MTEGARSLDQWLEYIGTLHPKVVAMGLDRVRAVFDELNLILPRPQIVVAGTNGKGSTCAMLESILRAGGYRVGLYTSPHLIRYNERVRIAGFDATDFELCGAFAAVEAARLRRVEPTQLTYFEFGTLAAFWLFARANLDVLVMEVGLGGRLDAVNVIDADVAVVTTIAIDHVDYLGSSREDIGREKAGIFRPHRPAFCADRDPPRSLLDVASEQDVDLRRLGIDYDYQNEVGQWRFWTRVDTERRERYGLGFPALRGAHQLANASTALAVLDVLADRLPVGMGAVRTGLAIVELPGRFQVLPGRPTVVLDVAHNAQAAAILNDALSGMGYYPTTYAVFGCMADKDIDAIIQALRKCVDHWLVTGLPGPRGASASLLESKLAAHGIPSEGVRPFIDPVSAFASAREQAGEADRILVFGSFLTVGAVLADIEKK